MSMGSQEIKQIETYLKSQGFSNQELIDDLTDHLATEIELSMNSEKLDFETSFEKAKQKLLPNSPYQLERDLKILTTPKHNIMIKKIAYIGGYLSAITICLSILFIALSFQNELQVEKRKEILESQFFRNEFTANMISSGVDIEELSEAQNKFYIETTQLKMSSLKKLELGQTLMIFSAIVFMVSYLPYRFYNSYQKNQLELTA